MNVPRARYSLRMSFCTVPDSLARSMPCRSAIATYMARRMIAVELIVIDVETRSSGMPSNSSAMSSSESIATPTRPTSPAASAMVRVVAHLCWQVERDAQSGHPLLEQVPIPPIRLGGGAKAGVLPHRPQPAAIHRRLDAPREGKLAGLAEVPVGIPARRDRPERDKNQPYKAVIAILSVLDSTQTRPYNETRPTFVVPESDILKI